MSAASVRPVYVFVAEHGNAFMRDIATWVVEAAQLAGRSAELIDDRLPILDGSINVVVAPHEFFLLRDDTDAEIRRAAACSVPICTEQPGTPWFLLSLGFCVGSPLVVDINATGLEAIEQQGFTAHRLRLGGVPSMDWNSRLDEPIDRNVDVVFLGGDTDRRAAALATLGPVLWDRNSEIRLFTFSRPLQGDEPGVVFGDEKYELLARSKILVNLHRDDDSDGYFEWARMVETMANGCVVVTEPSVGHQPLVADRHFIEADIESLADTVRGLLGDDERRHRIADAAHDAVMNDGAFVHGVTELLDRIERDGLLLEVPHRSRSERRALRRPIVRDHAPPLLPVFEPHRAIRRELYGQFLAEANHRRELSRLRAVIEHGDADHVDEFTTTAWTPGDTTDAEITVTVTLFNYAEVVLETLDSIVASSDVDLEIVIVDDRSSDDSIEVVRAWMADHDQVPVMLLASAVNRGLARARNLAIRRARAEFVMIMDADNHVYPTCLRRLADALHADPEAAMAYATLEAFGPAPGLRSAQGWHVPWLCEKNYIDAQSLIRRTVLERYDGYLLDDFMYGWEDWEMWLRFAANGDYGVHVPELLGRYRTQLSSMISLTNLAADDLRADLRRRYPDLPWP